MLEHTMIDWYLEEVDSYLHVDRAQRARVLDEIEGHLRDAVEAHVGRGVPADQAMEHAVEELGSPMAVAMQFSAAPSPARAIRGWRRWTPVALPAVLLAITVGLTAWHLSALVTGGQTVGGKVVLRSYLVYTAVIGLLAAGTYVAIRQADRDPSWRRAAWVFAGLSGIFVVVMRWS